MTNDNDLDITPSSDLHIRKDIYAYHEHKSFDEANKSEKNKQQKKDRKAGSKTKPQLKNVKKKLGSIYTQPLRRLF